MADLSMRVGATVLDEARDLEFFDALNDLGSGSMTLTYDDPDISTAGVGLGDVVDVRLDSTVVGRWLIESVERRRITDPESDTGYVFSGRTVLAELERTIVFPPRPPREVTSPIFTGWLAPKPTTLERHLGPMDPDYDVSGWSTVTEVAAPTGSLAPVAWNDPDAHWIGGDFDVAWYSTTFSTSGAFAVTLMWASADHVEVWMDGALMARVDPAVDDGTASRTRKVVVEVNDGTHHMAVRVARITSDDNLLLLTGWVRGTSTNVVRTDSTWKVLADTPAGYTPHEVIDILLAESQSRSEATGWTLTSSASADTDSAAWDLLPDDFAVRVGDSLLDVLRQMSDAYVDFGCRPADTARQLSLWVAGTRGGASGVTWSEGGAVISSEHRITDSELRNRVLLVWAGGNGIIRGQMDASVTANGPRSVLLNLDQVADGPAALDMALATIAPMASAEESVLLGVEPAGSDVPGVNVLLGDTVTAPNIDGTPSTYRLSACTWSQDGDVVVFEPEMATARDIEGQRWARWLARTNNGTINGRSRSATVSSGSIVQQAEVVEAIVVTFSGSGLEAGDTATPKAADRRQRLVKLEARCNVAGVGNTTYTVLRNGTSTGDAVTLGNAQTSATAWFAAGETFEVADIIGLELTAENGHDETSVELHFVEPGG